MAATAEGDIYNIWIEEGRNVFGTYSSTNLGEGNTFWVFGVGTYSFRGHFQWWSGQSKVKNMQFLNRWSQPLAPRSNLKVFNDSSYMISYV